MRESISRSVVLSHPALFITLDKMLFSIKKYLYFSHFLIKTYVVGTH